MASNQPTSTSSPSKLIKNTGKTNELLKNQGICARTLQISNIPKWLTSEQIKQSLSRHNIEEVHIPTDNLNRQFGFGFVTFKLPDDCEQFLSNISNTNKYLYLSSDFSSGPLRFSTVKPVHVEKDNEFYKYTMTNPTNPDDQLAINIGKLYVDINNKMQDELKADLKAVIDAQKQKDLDELAELQRKAQDKKKEVEDIKKEAQVKEKEADTAQKQVDQRIDELKRKYGSIDS